jgi:glutathione peroxidase
MGIIKQKITRFLYPLILRRGRKGHKGTMLSNTQHKKPTDPFHQLSVVLNTGKTLDFSTLPGKKVLIVNTASDCGYTGQYEQLQSLFEEAGDKLMIIGFPANDFGAQEQGSNDEIAQFCKVNYGVTFPIVQKSVIVKQADQHPVFRWLTHASLNGWNDHAPDWNFSKYLVDETGILTHYFGSAISPLDETVLKELGI